MSVREHGHFFWPVGQALPALARFQLVKFFPGGAVLCGTPVCWVSVRLFLYHHKRQSIMKNNQVFDESAGRMVPVYTNEDFVRALKERFPDGLELGIGWLQADHVNDYMQTDSFNGYDAIDAVIGREAAYEDGLYLEARIKLSPDDYDRLEPGGIDVTDPDWIAAFSRPGYNPEDLWATSVMNGHPDLKGAPVMVPQDLAVKHMVVEGTHIHDLMAMVLKNHEMDTQTMKDVCQLHGVYMRKGAFFDEGWSTAAAVRTHVSDDWQKYLAKALQEDAKSFTVEELRDIYDSTVRKQAEVALGRMEIMGYEPRSFKVDIGRLYFPGGDTGAARQMNLDRIAARYNELYEKEHLMYKAAYAVHPPGADHLLVNVNTVNPLRHMLAVDRIKTLPSFKGAEELPYQNILLQEPNVAQSVLDVWQDRVEQVKEEKNNRPLMQWQNKGGIYLHEKGRLGYAHISRDRTLLVNGSPMTPDHSRFVQDLATKGNIALHRDGLHSCMLLCEPQDAEKRLMIDTFDGSAHHVTVQTAIDGRQYLTVGTRMLDRNRYMDVQGRVTGASLYGSGERLFVRASIDGEQQPGRLLKKKDVERLTAYAKQGAGIPPEIVEKVAAEQFLAELEQGVQQQQNRGRGL